MKSPRQLVFEQIEAAAIKGARCPQSHEFPKGLSSKIYSLATDGWIHIETYALNWRVVQILRGPNAGKRTQACPHNHDGPWRITDKNGARYPHQDARWKERETTITPHQRET